MAAPESNSNAEASDIKRPNELIDSNSSPRKRLKTEDELKTEGTTNEASSANGSSQKGFFALEADAAEDKGSRHSMEDAWVVLLDASLESPGNLRQVSSYEHLLLSQSVCFGLLAFFFQNFELDVKCAKKAILNGGWQDGATAVCMWVLGQTVFVANIGDAKAVVARSAAADGSQSGLDSSKPLKAIVLTREHKAIYPQERARIQKAGGSISSNGRLQGRLEVSRAFGDRQFKKMWEGAPFVGQDTLFLLIVMLWSTYLMSNVIHEKCLYEKLMHEGFELLIELKVRNEFQVGVVAIPDVHSFDLTERDHFIILGCDGLWGVFGPSDAVDFVHKLLKEGLPVTAVCRRLVREAVRERLCKDNCTAVVIVFRQH
ncbi:hypothetical protein DH2020_038586 [Rehmannia glutinosa]|uniref:PPM-type phosphatase domain-containing protein n=1 Tax=Rehmannia glutinosa TaxID=99300 RepID=A0ABR0UY45_REHGL